MGHLSTRSKLLPEYAEPIPHNTPTIMRPNLVSIMVLCAIAAVEAHVAMLHPPSWSDAGGKTGMTKGWQWRLGNEPRVPRLVGSGSTSALAWFNNFTWINKSTLDPS